jgi:hypothetical protein
MQEGEAPAAPGFYRSCADALTDGFCPQSGLVQRGVFYAACRQLPLWWLAPPPFLPLRGGTMGAGQWRQFEFMTVTKKNHTTGLRPEENKPASLCSWKCTPIPACGDFPRRGKFALLSASEFISISKHSAARISPSGGDVAAGDRRGAFPAGEARLYGFPAADRRQYTHRSKGDTTTLSHVVAVKPENLQNPRPARAVNPHAAGVSKGDTTTL